MNSELNVSRSNQDDAVEPYVDNESIAEHDVLFLKSLIVTDENMPIFAEKLNSTREYRLKLLLDKEIHLKEWFPYFFTHPQLVLFTLYGQFHVIFSNVFDHSQVLMEFSLAHPAVKASAFLDMWPSISQQLRGILTNHYKRKKFKTDWCAEIEDILVVLKLFPANQVGRNAVASIPNLNKSINQFIHFEPVTNLILTTFQDINCSKLAAQRSTIAREKRISTHCRMRQFHERYQVLFYSNRKSCFSCKCHKFSIIHHY